MTKIRCPECRGILSVQESESVLDDFRKSTIKCNFCGYRRLLSSRNEMGIFISLHKMDAPVLDEWGRNVLLLEKSLSNFKRLSHKARKRHKEAKVVKTPKEVKVRKSLKEATPTAAQRRRGATHPVNCSFCGTITFRRKKEWEPRKVAYCSPSCKKQGNLRGSGELFSGQKTHQKRG